MFTLPEEFLKFIRSPRSRNLLILFLSASFCGLPLWAQNQLTVAEQKQGWELLFDGSTSKGWLEVTGKPFPGNSWSIEDGCLRSLVRPGGAQDIRTVSTFRSFDLQWDWRLGERGNSGVKYLIQTMDEWTNAEGRQARARGLEYQLAGEHEPDAASDPTRFAGSLYSIIAPSPKIIPLIGSFNHSRVLVKGDYVEHWLNGARVVEFDLTAPEVQSQIRKMAPKGAAADAPIARDTPISLQNHSSEVWIRNIKIRRLE
jgi:hypothetical protein